VRAAVIVLVALAGIARADDDGPPPHPFHLSFGAGGALWLTGTAGEPRNRADVHLDVMPGGRLGPWGVTFAMRGLTYSPFAHDGLATIGVHYQAAAARPRLAVAVQGDVGLAIAARARAIGGGIETHLWLWPKRLGPLALVFDVTSHLVIDGVDDTRLVIAAATRLALAW
jgi:hypothetical protein